MPSRRDQPNAVESMLLEDQANGHEVLTEPPPPRPPVVSSPLVPVAIPKPDWREVEEDRLRREQAEQQARLEPEPEAYSAKPKMKTPNLAKARQLQADAKGLGKGAL